MPVELNNSVFYHIPKTGGTFVTRYLTEIGGKIEKPLAEHPNRFCKEHTRPCDYPTDKKSFSFIRHPLGWYQSYWRFKTGGKELLEQQDWDKKNAIYECRDTDFNRFVNKMLDKWPQGYVSWMYSQFPTDYVGRQENLKYDLISILYELGEDFNPLDIIEMRNVNVSTGYEAEYNRETLLRVLEVEKGALKFYES